MLACRGVSSNDASAIRLMGAIFADLHDEWKPTDRRYLALRELHGPDLPPPHLSRTQCPLISEEPVF